MKILLRHGKAIAALAVGLVAVGCAGCADLAGSTRGVPGYFITSRVYGGLTDRNHYLGSIDKLGPAVSDGKALYLTLTYTRSADWHVVRIDPRDGSSDFVRKVPPGCRLVERRIVKDEESRPERMAGGCVCVWSDGSAHPFFAPRVRCLGIGGVGDRAVNVPAYGVDRGAASLALLCLPAAVAESVVVTSLVFYSSACAAPGGR